MRQGGRRLSLWAQWLLGSRDVGVPGSLGLGGSGTVLPQLGSAPLGPATGLAALPQLTPSPHARVAASLGAVAAAGGGVLPSTLHRAASSTSVPRSRVSAHAPTVNSPVRRPASRPAPGPGAVAQRSPGRPSLKRPRSTSPVGAAGAAGRGGGSSSSKRRAVARAPTGVGRLEPAAQDAMKELRQLLPTVNARFPRLGSWEDFVKNVAATWLLLNAAKEGMARRTPDEIARLVRGAVERAASPTAHVATAPGGPTQAQSSSSGGASEATAAPGAPPAAAAAAAFSRAAEALNAGGVEAILRSDPLFVFLQHPADSSKPMLDVRVSLLDPQRYFIPACQLATGAAPPLWAGAGAAGAPDPSAKGTAVPLSQKAQAQKQHALAQQLDRQLDWLPPLPAALDAAAAAIDARHPPAASPESFLKNHAARFLLRVELARAKPKHLTSALGGYLKQAWLQQTLHAEPQPTTRLPALLQDDPLFGGPRRRPSQPAAAGATGTVASTSTDPASDAVHERASGTEAASSAEAIERGAAERPEAAGVPGEVWMPRLQLQLLGLTPEALRSATTLVQPSAGGVGGPGAGPVPAREASAVGSGPQGARPLGPAPGLRFPAEMDGLLEAIDARFPLATSPESFLKNQAARYLLWAGRQAPPRPVIMSALGSHVQREWQLQTYHDRSNNPKGYSDSLSTLLFSDPLFAPVEATPGSIGRRRRTPLTVVPQLDVSQLQADLAAQLGELDLRLLDTPDLSTEPGQSTQTPSKLAPRDRDLPPLPANLADIAAAIDARHPPAASPEHFIKNRAARYLLWWEQEQPHRAPKKSLASYLYKAWILQTLHARGEALAGAVARHRALLAADPLFGPPPPPTRSATEQPTAVGQQAAATDTEGPHGATEPAVGELTAAGGMEGSPRTTQPALGEQAAAGSPQGVPASTEPGTIATGQEEPGARGLVVPSSWVPQLQLQVLGLPEEVLARARGREETRAAMAGGTPGAGGAGKAALVSGAERGSTGRARHGAAVVGSALGAEGADEASVLSDAGSRSTASTSAIGSSSNLSDGAGSSSSSSSHAAAPGHPAEAWPGSLEGLVGLSEDAEAEAAVLKMLGRWREPPEGEVGRRAAEAQAAAAGPGPNAVWLCPKARSALALADVLYPPGHSNAAMAKNALVRLMAQHGEEDAAGMRMPLTRASSLLRNAVAGQWPKMPLLVNLIDGDPHFALVPRPLPWSDPLCRLLGGAAQGASREDDLLLAVDSMVRSGRRLAGFRRMAEVDRKGAERLAAELADAEVVAEVLPEAVETTAVVQAGAGAGAVQGVERAVASSPALVERAVSKFLNAWILPNNRLKPLSPDEVGAVLLGPNARKDTAKRAAEQLQQQGLASPQPPAATADAPAATPTTAPVPPVAAASVQAMNTQPVPSPIGKTDLLPAASAPAPSSDVGLEAVAGEAVSGEVVAGDGGPTTTTAGSTISSALQVSETLAKRRRGYRARQQQRHQALLSVLRRAAEPRPGEASGPGGSHVEVRHRLLSGTWWGRLAPLLPFLRQGEQGQGQAAGLGEAGGEGVGVGVGSGDGSGDGVVGAAAPERAVQGLEGSGLSLEAGPSVMAATKVDGEAAAATAAPRGSEAAGGEAALAAAAAVEQDGAAGVAVAGEGAAAEQQDPVVTVDVGAEPLPEATPLPGAVDIAGDGGSGEQGMPPGGEDAAAAEGTAQGLRVVLVQAPGSLAYHTMLNHLRSVEAIAMDLEMSGGDEGRDSLSGRSITLMQIAAPAVEDRFPRTVYLVDFEVARTPRQRVGLAAGLKPLLTSPQLLKVLHAPHMDVTLLRRQYGIAVHPVLDTQQVLAAAMAAWAGSPLLSRQLLAASPGLALLLQCVGLSHDTKDEFKSIYKTDPNFWCRRPLTAAMVQYAVQDVAHLLDAYRALLRDILRTQPPFLQQHGSSPPPATASPEARLDPVHLAELWGQQPAWHQGAVRQQLAAEEARRQQQEVGRRQEEHQEEQVQGEQQEEQQDQEEQRR